MLSLVASSSASEGTDTPVLTSAAAGEDNDRSPARSCCPTVHGLVTTLRTMAPLKKLELMRTLCDELDWGWRRDPLASRRLTSSLREVLPEAGAEDRPSSPVIERISSSA